MTKYEQWIRRCSIMFQETYDESGHVVDGFEARAEVCAPNTIDVVRTVQVHRHGTISSRAALNELMAGLSLAIAQACEEDEGSE